MFGLARGVLLVLLGLALVRFGLPVEEDGWWQASRLVPIFNVGLIGFCQNCWRYLKASQILSLKEAICVG